ncbi:cellobiose-specific phosphotransferase system component IIB [Clostridium beijerinckii]|nr:cellobiose-specific phosphotransferase system component IIB [Clostridium beijerinckii]NRZ56577.1 cellobiose-specific phosphotransferase system component IIB [Clostridium beijerinckii]
MRYITLVCAAGMSTSILMARMQESAKKTRNRSKDCCYVRIKI